MRFSSATVLAIIAALVPSISAMPATSVADSPFGSQHCYKACWYEHDCKSTERCTSVGCVSISMFLDLITRLTCMAERFLVLLCASYLCLNIME
ncbi:uncharacterized protein EDB93DRAFT_1173617 [Suillus bovinus]|uniref:uncharacterized protein n=1 Tax=Suillus bovinus TaxID=48563 RepID=UPI001B864950|nr:uncharacterized protein EDB93DRAFT_1173617 [Suillus bovinus]KAG2133820.1 hypothetical protein EDB93DRAFT_1173617 [Suillus bovinus]